MKWTATIIGGVLLFVAVSAPASPTMRMQVSPLMSFEPTDLRVQVIAERNDDNRLLRVTAQSENFESSSDRQLEGMESAKVTTIEFRQVPAGEYRVHAFIIGANGRTRAEARQQVTVVSKMGH